MTQERRRSKRMDINASIKLNSLRTGEVSEKVNKEVIDVEVVNISKDGLAFVSSEKIELGAYYDTTVLLWTKEKFQSVIEVVRTEKIEDDDRILYGCHFVGIMPSDQLKIQIYEMVSEMEKEEQE